MTEKQKIQTTQEPYCIRCEHYYVTWEVGKPHGCRAFGFKSKRMPSWEVKEVSGEMCLRFEAKMR